MFQPNYKITHKILKDIAHIEAAKEIIENSPLIPSYERKFKDEALIRAVHYSTHIEGNPLNFSDAKKVLEGKAEDLVARERDINDIINYRNVLKYIENIQKAPIDEKTILTIHKVVMDKILTSEKSGKFRLEKVAVRNSKTKEISFTPPKAEEVGKLVQDFILWLSSQEAKETFPVLKAGISHYELARIHPFVDGNKRSGAFAFIWFLKKAKSKKSRNINPGALTALTLLVAESNPKHKDQMVALITQILK